jgi:2-keto-3-deoxy-L-rhamnonate aldolase RhmA
VGVLLKSLLAQPDRVIKVFALGQLCHPKMVELVAGCGGFDAVWLDHEHAGLSTAQIEEAARAARGCGLDSFVRMAATDYAGVMRMFEAGAGGIMAAMVKGAAEAEELMAWSKFHPRGRRGINGSGVDGRYGSDNLAEYMARANAETVVGVQIERVEALEEVERIAAVPGLDFLFVGPADLSQSLGIPGQWDHPRLTAAVERVAKAAKANRLPWGILPRDLAHAQRCVALGCRLLSIGIDTWFVQRGVAAWKKDFAE